VSELDCAAICAVAETAVPDGVATIEDDRAAMVVVGSSFVGAAQFGSGIAATGVSSCAGASGTSGNDEIPRASVVLFRLVKERPQF